MVAGGMGLDGGTGGSKAGEGGAQGDAEGEMRIGGSGGGEARRTSKSRDPGTDVEPHLAEEP